MLLFWVVRTTLYCPKSWSIKICIYIICIDWRGSLVYIYLKNWQGIKFRISSFLILNTLQNSLFTKDHSLWALWLGCTYSSRVLLYWTQVGIALLILQGRWGQGPMITKSVCYPYVSRIKFNVWKCVREVQGFGVGMGQWSQLPHHLQSVDLVCIVHFLSQINK